MKFLTGWTIDLNNLPSYNLLDNNIFIEDIDNKLAEFILDNPNIRNEDKQKFTEYLQGNNTQLMKVKYTSRFLIGRRYANNDLIYKSGLITQKRCIKNTLFKYFGYVDIDQVKGHPTIIYELSLRNNIVLNAYEKYLTQFDKICSQIILFYNDNECQLQKKHIKLLFNAIIYGGSFNTWKNQMINDKDIKINNQNVVMTFIKDFITDTQTIMRLIWDNNIQLRMHLRKENETEYKLKSRMMSYFFGIIENDITYNAYIYLLHQKIIKQNKISWGYDGITFKQNKIFNIDELNDFITYKTGFNQVKFIRKSFDEVDENALRKIILYKTFGLWKKNTMTPINKII